jgi:hypothetical protein
MKSESAPAMAAAAAPATTTTTTTSIEAYWKTTSGREALSKESWYLHGATASHICGDQQRFKLCTEYTKRQEREIRDFVGRKAGKATGHGDVPLRPWLPGGRKHVVVVGNVLDVREAYNSLSQSLLIDGGVQIVPVNGYGIKIYNKLLPGDSARRHGCGPGMHVGVARQI